MSQEFANNPPKGAPRLPVPEGLTQCLVCNEYRGVMALGGLPNFSSSIYRSEDPNTPLTVQCICDGVLCPSCKKNKFHKPISNTWTERGGFGHIPYFRGWLPCNECYQKRSEEYAARRRKTIDQSLAEDSSNPESEVSMRLLYPRNFKIGCENCEGLLLPGEEVFCSPCLNKIKVPEDYQTEKGELYRKRLLFVTKSGVGGIAMLGIQLGEPFCLSVPLPQCTYFLGDEAGWMNLGDGEYCIQGINPLGERVFVYEKDWHVGAVVAVIPPLQSCS
jgi:hypothetical protein